MNTNNLNILDVLFTGEITQIDLKEKERIERMPIAQKRATIYKKFVRIDRDFVIKGPYYLNEKRFKKVVQVNSAMKIFDDYYGVDTFKQIHSILVYKQEYYIRWQLIGNYDDIQLVEQTTTVDKEMFVSVKRGTLCKRITDIEKSPLHFTPKIANDVVHHLYFRYLLEISDSGPHNILFDEQTQSICGIDFDETKREIKSLNFRATRFNTLFGTTGTVQRQRLYENHLSTFKFLTVLPPDIEDELSALKFNLEDIKLRLKLFTYLVN